MPFVFRGIRNRLIANQTYFTRNSIGHSGILGNIGANAVVAKIEQLVMQISGSTVDNIAHVDASDDSPIDFDRFSMTPIDSDVL